MVLTGKVTAPRAQPEFFGNLVCAAFTSQAGSGDVSFVI